MYFDKLQSGEAAQLLQTMGQHTVGLRLQRRGDRSPLGGHSCGQQAMAPGSPEIVLVSGEGRRRMEGEEDGGRMRMRRKGRRRKGMRVKMKMRMRWGWG